MTGQEKLLVGVFAITGLIIGFSLSTSTTDEPSIIHEVVDSVPNQPDVAPVATKDVSPAMTRTDRARADRYYQDRHGDIVSEKVVEDSLKRIRKNIQAMPNNAVRAFKEGQLQFLEEEWARMKQKGPVEPIRAVNKITGKEILIGEAPLPEYKRRQIFYELVEAQDSGVGDREAYTLIAERYGISDLMVNEIGLEGAAKKWPMP